jgi:hypothetical protein
MLACSKNNFVRPRFEPPFKRQKVDINTDSTLLPVTLVSNMEKENLGTFEPLKNRSRKQKSAAFGDANPMWLRDQESS